MIKSGFLSDFVRTYLGNITPKRKLACGNLTRGQERELVPWFFFVITTNKLQKTSKDPCVIVSDIDDVSFDCNSSEFYNINRLSVYLSIYSHTWRNVMVNGQAAKATL